MNVIPNVPRKLVREIRAMIHVWERYGYAGAEETYREKFAHRTRRPGSGSLSFRRSLKGKLDYLQMVKGAEDSVYRKYRNRLHRLDPYLVAQVPEREPIDPSIDGALDQRPTDAVWTRWYEEYSHLVYHLEIRTGAGDVFGGTAFAYRPGLLATAAHNLEGDIELAAPLEERISPLGSATHPDQSNGADVAIFCACRKGPRLVVAICLSQKRFRGWVRQ